MRNKHNPETFAINGRSFNEYAVAGKSLEEFIKYGKERYKGPFFGRRTDAEQTELLTEVHRLATEIVKKHEANHDWVQVGVSLQEHGKEIVEVSKKVKKDENKAV